MTRGITFTKGTGDSDLMHDTREHIADNVDVNRIKDNVVLKRETLKSAYETCFGAAAAEYDGKQKRKDRKINDYFKYLFGVSASDKQKSRNILINKDKCKSFYENVVQIGDMYNTGIKNDPKAANLAKQALIAYFNGDPKLGIESYAKRNPQFYVFEASVHMDESTPHLHLCYVPIATGYQRGMKVQNGHDKALKQMGFERHTDYINHEREVFREICKSYGLEPREKEDEKGRGHTYTTYEYTAKAEQIRKADKKLREANMPSVASTEPEKPVEASEPVHRSNKRNGKQKPVEKPTEALKFDISKMLLEANQKAHQEAVNNMRMQSADEVLKDLGLDSTVEGYGNDIEV